MNPALNKLEVTSLISKYLRTCPYLFECVGLYGSVVKNNSYRDIDILFIVSNSDDIESLKEWVKKWLEPLFTVPLDAKYYSIESFSNLIENNSPLVLSIAVEIEFIIPHLQIEKKLVGLKDVLFNKGIDTSQHYRLIISQEILSKILYEENKSLRGFLISHVDWIKNDNQEIRELLRVLAPIDEPYTRIACLKQAIKLLHSNQYRQHLNFSIGESINLATQIVLNRKNFNWNTHEDYSNKDLCLELVSLVEKFPPSLWSKAEGLLSALTQDFNHYVRYSMIKFIYNKILPSDSEMGFDLLTVAFKSERKIWIVSEISLTYFVNQTVIDKERLKLIIEGYNKKNNKLKLSTRITNFLELLNQPFENNNLTIPFLVVFFEKLSNFHDETQEINELNASYLTRVLSNVKEASLQIILAKIIQKNQINVNELEQILIELQIPITPEVLKKIISITRELNNTVLLSADNYNLSVQLNETLQKLHSLDILNARKIILEYLLKHIGNFLKKIIKDTKIYPFFYVTIKPRFGLKINKEQFVKFFIKNITDTHVPNVNLSLQSSAEIDIFSYFGDFPFNFHPGEQIELRCIIKPKVAKQIAISYKINGEFGEPIYISADRENPFVPNNPVWNAHFVGREKELQYIREEIHQQHFLLFGPRRIGKTSLLFQLKEELKEGYIPIYISLQTFNFNVIDSASLFDEILKKVAIELLEIKKIFYFHLETIDNKIRYIKNCLEDEKVVLLIDEMDVGQGVENFNIFLEQMRVIMQQEGWLRIILSSGPFITRNLIDPQSPLFNMVSHISVNRLTTEAAEKLLRLAEDQDIVFEEDVIRDCLQWTGNLPLYLQILGDHIYQCFKNKNISERRVSQKNLIQIQQIMRNDIVEWERMWNMLNNIEKAIIAFCAYQDDLIDIREVKYNIEKIVSNNIAFKVIREGLNNLVWFGLLVEEEHGYKLTAKLIQDWLTNQLYYPEEIQELFIGY